MTAMKTRKPVAESTPKANPIARPSRKLWAERPAAPRMPTRSLERVSAASSRSWRTSSRSAKKKARKPAATRAVAWSTSPTPSMPSGSTSSRAMATTTPPVSASSVCRWFEKRSPIWPPAKVASTVSPARGIAIDISALLLTFGADAAQEDVVGDDLELGRIADGVDRLLQAAVLEGEEAAAAHADDVVVVLAGVGALVGDHLAADVDPVDEVELLQLLERAVDRRPPDRGEATVDFQRGDRAVLAVEQLDHPAARGTAPESRLAQTRLCSFGPAHGPGHYMKTRIILVYASAVGVPLFEIWQRVEGGAALVPAGRAPHLEMQVTALGVAGFADDRDRLAGAYGVAGAQRR